MCRSGGNIIRVKNKIIHGSPCHPIVFNASNITESLDNTATLMTVIDSLENKIHYCVPSEDRVEASVEIQLSPCGQVIMSKDQAQMAMTVLEDRQSPEAPNTLMEYRSRASTEDFSNEAFQAGPAPSSPQRSLSSDLRRRANTSGSDQSKKSHRSLLGDRPRRLLNACARAPQILIGAIVGQSDVVIMVHNDKDPTITPSNIFMTRSSMKQRMRKISLLVKDMLRCIRILSKPFSACARKPEELTLLRSSGYLT